VTKPNTARYLPWAVWLTAAVVLTLVMWLLRDRLDKAHIALLYLLPVLGGAAHGGRRLGLVLAGLTFVAFNFLFLQPHYTLRVFDGRDWLVLAIYLITAAVAAQLLYRAKSASARAQRLAASEQALLEADRVKDALLAAVSHDLRTPLTSIKAIAHDLAEAGHATALDIETQADQLNRLVTDLLDLSRLKAAAMPTHMEINAAEDVVGAVMDQLGPILNGRDVHISIDTNAPLLLGKFDFVHTMRILTNLMDNAHKYSPYEAPVELSASREGPWLRFAVTDRGPGIAAGEEERVFEEFYRSPNAKTSGVGLGLAIARQLAELQGGSLQHEVRAGGGTSFVLSLPAAEAP
jgi:K+-sensing histidine kinase KdpD